MTNVNKIFCWLTGGHKYQATNLIIYTDYGTDEAVFMDTCVKCSAPHETRIKWGALRAAVAWEQEGDE